MSKNVKAEKNPTQGWIWPSTEEESSEFGKNFFPHAVLSSALINFLKKRKTGFFFQLLRENNTQDRGR